MRLLKYIGVNVLALALFWIVSFLLVQLGYVVNKNIFVTYGASQLLGCLIGLAIALVIRASLAAYVIAGFLAFTASEIGTHLYFGLTTSVQYGHLVVLRGAPTHFAIIGAAQLGIALGAVLSKWGSSIAAKQHSIHRP